MSRREPWKNKPAASAAEYLLVIVVALLQFAAFAWVAGQAERANDRADRLQARLDRVSEGCAVRLDDGYTLCRPGVVVHESGPAK